jgi:hypothetical protein
MRAETAPNTYHIWAHLRTWSKNQFTLFIHVVKKSWQLGRQRVGSGLGFIKQTLAIPSAMGSRNTQIVRTRTIKGSQEI